ncbi:multidrug efflux RND transporter permease subunit [Sphingobium lignivorans]|uniref:Efflux pump membrane transporter n=1 Tax=Sphingobium lignivorans TaxID=2735886 RepID=A0ABR6NAS3_9SPHN|nr:multidrug efflux RND transporter permease subunit [Sphingobium lignivorans]MBB5984379.1 multidrug efflux pump [Sphingobium lignivorans]
MLSRIFIDRPILAWVLATIVMLSGIGAIYSLPIAQYPDIAPPQVSISANYPGASAEAVQNSVTQVIEQSLNGIDGLLYFTSSSDARGRANITATFDKGTDPDIAQVQVQNQLQSVIARLPQQVQQSGVQVRKANSDMLLIVGFYDASNRMSAQQVSDYLSSNLQDTLSRVPGVGNVNVFGSPNAMRIWLNPERLTSFQLMPGDVIAAIQAQNTEVAAGQLGAEPSAPDQYLNVNVTAQARLQTPEQFRDIVVKTLPTGATVRLGDVARVEIGADNYTVTIHVNGHPGAGVAFMLAPGADALTTAELIKARVAELSDTFPEGFEYGFAQDTTAFIKLSISEVTKTLIEAIILVVIVMFVFLQNWRATLIPTIAVPVVLLGTFGVLYVAGFTINTLTLFGLVLSIGLLVDDAIVVVENVERLMAENPGMTAREATIRSMREITMALIAIALVLSAVFMPMALFGGSTGVIYRQFAITIVSAMILSVFVAIILSPALTAHLLKPHRESDAIREGDRSWMERRLPRLHGWLLRARDGFNSRFDRGIDHYVAAVRKIVDRRGLSLAIYALVVLLLIVMFQRLPTGFLPNEDQGVGIVSFQLPTGATINRTAEVQKAVEDYFAEHESGTVATLFTVAGTSGPGGAIGQNVGRGFIMFKPWEERPGPENTAEAVSRRASGALSGLRDAQIFALTPPAIPGLGQSTGFEAQILNTGNLSAADFAAARDKVVAAARADPELAAVRLQELPDQAALRVDVDHQKLAALGLNQSDVNLTLSSAWGGRYINDFVDRGRVKRVYVQGDAPYRAKPEDLGQWHVRGGNGQMTPFASFATLSWSMTPPSLSRFNGIPSYQLLGQAAPGYSSGEAMRRIEQHVADIPGIGLAFSGLSYQERLLQGQGPLLYALSLLVVFLFLAALYESWSIPIAVLLIVPLGLVGAVLAVTLRGLINDIFLQIGLLTTMGLAAKNAILMIEFAEQAEKRGMRIIDAAAEAARRRLRPILMTSFAFIFGVLPLAVSTGAGANGRIAIGTAVIGGMLTATVLAIFYIPLFFVIVRRLTRDTLQRISERIVARRAGRKEP